MIELFGEEWTALLGKEGSKILSRVGNLLNKEYLKADLNVIPNIGSSLFFKCFKDLPPSKVKVVFLGNEPYNEITPYGYVYTGYAYDNSNSIRESPALTNILKEIDRSYPENKSTLEYGLDDFDLNRWVKQGVLLPNLSFTSVEDRSNAHLGIWREFTEYWITRFSETYNDIIWILRGPKVQYFGNRMIKNPSHYKIEVGYNTNKSNCFKICNEELEARNKLSIIW